MADWADDKARTMLARWAASSVHARDHEMAAAELRAAYERGVREAATVARIAWENGDSADVARVRILALLDKEGGGDG